MWPVNFAAVNVVNNFHKESTKHLHLFSVCVHRPMAIKKEWVVSRLRARIVLHNS